MLGSIRNKITIINIAAIYLLLVFFLQCFFSALKESPTSDEPTHISAGYAYLKNRSLEMNSEHPVFIKALSALPLFIFNIDGFFDSEEFKAGHKDQERYAELFLFENKEPYSKITLTARVPIIILGLILGLYVFLWAKELFGNRAGLLALLLYSFSPTIIAHSRLVTTDIGVTAFIFIFFYYLWKLYQKKQIKFLILSGISLGLAFVSKYTALYLVPLLILITAIEIFIGIKNKNNLWKKKIIWVLLIFFISWVIIWAFYLPFGKPYLSEEKTMFFMMPHYFAKGAGYLLDHTQRGHDSFFFGEKSEEGWWYYYIVSFLIKVPLPFLVILFIYFILKIFKLLEDKKNAYIIYLTPLFIILWSSLLNKTNIGIRHILPIFPFIFLLTSHTINVKIKRRVYKKIFYAVIAVLIVWCAANSLWTYPNYLMHFNGLVGGPKNGWKYSVVGDDWGQGDTEAVKWLKKEGYKKFNFLPLDGGSEKIIKATAKKEKIGASRVRCDKKNDTLSNLKNEAPFLFHISTAQREGCLNKILKYEPYAKIGYAIFIYDFQKQGIDIDEFRK